MDTVYEALADVLRRDIVEGKLKPGDYLPSEVALKAEHLVCRGTVRRAIDELIGEGLVVSLRGRGNQVRQAMPLIWRASDPERNTETGEGPSDVWSRGVRAQGYEPSEDIVAEIGYADERVASLLRVSVGEPVSIRRRLRSVNGKPYHTADSFYPRALVAGTEIEEPGHITPGVYAVFERLGRPWVRTTDSFTGRAPTRKEATDLSIPRGVPVIEVARRSFDAGGVAVRLTRFVLPGDRHDIEYEHEKRGTTS